MATSSNLVVLKLILCGFGFLFIFSEVLTYDLSVFCLIQLIFSFTSHSGPAAETYPQSMMLLLPDFMVGMVYLLTLNIALRARLTKKMEQLCAVVFIEFVTVICMYSAPDLLRQQLITQPTPTE